MPSLAEGNLPARHRNTFVEALRSETFYRLLFKIHKSGTDSLRGNHNLALLPLQRIGDLPRGIVITGVSR